MFYQALLLISFVNSIILINWGSLYVYNHICYQSLWLSYITTASPFCILIQQVHVYGTMLYSHIIYIILGMVLTQCGEFMYRKTNQIRNM